MACCSFFEFLMNIVLSRAWKMEKHIYSGMATTRIKPRQRCGMVRVSPAFATFVAGLPGLSGNVALVAEDKGLEGAVKSKFA
jgi:hypothetical protein